VTKLDVILLNGNNIAVVCASEARVHAGCGAGLRHQFR
jgi:hypothetical protein